MTENRMTVLVVDDTPENIHILVNMLSSDYRTKVATNGEGALRLALKEPQPDLILLDVLMPGMDGYELCRRLKANPVTASIPVLFVTGTASEEDLSKGRSLGAEGFLMKPLDPNNVLETVKRTIGETA
jgi:putative two-component system response regulator